jgi:glycosyltransferase involved in cell wall biosynthesis
MPSLKEGTPITILESFLAETPVVASNVGGIKEQIENGINGYIVEPRNINEFAKKTKELLIDAQQNKRFTKKSKHVLNKKFKLSNHVKQIINVYKELTSHF